MFTKKYDASPPPLGPHFTEKHTIVFISVKSKNLPDNALLFPPSFIITAYFS